MSDQAGYLRQEAAFHDEIYDRTIVDAKTVQRLLAFHSPGMHLADRIPRLERTLLQRLGVVKRKRVLVYGCGDDCAPLWFSKSGASVDAIDISPKAIEIQERLAAVAGLAINAVVMDGNRLNLPSHEYDIVYGNAILHHLRLSEAIPEIGRVLRPGGVAVFRDVMRGGLFLRVFRRLTPFMRTPDEHPLTPDDFLLLKSRFDRCEIDYYVLCGQPYRFLVQDVNPILKRMGLNTRIPHSTGVYAALDRVDGALLRLIPRLRYHAWLCLITLST